MKWRTSKVVPSYGESAALLQPKKSYWVARFSKNLWGKIIKGLKNPNTYVEVICALLIILFIYTGLNKMIGYDKFRFEIGRSPFIQNISGIISVCLPISEILIAAALIFQKTRLLALYFSFFIMSLFSGYIWIMLKYAYDLPCSCGGVLAAMSWKDHLIFNSIFTILALAGVLIQCKLTQLKTNNSIQVRTFF